MTQTWYQSWHLDDYVMEEVSIFLNCIKHLYITKRNLNSLNVEASKDPNIWTKAFLLLFVRQWLIGWNVSTFPCILISLCWGISQTTLAVQPVTFLLVTTPALIIPLLFALFCSRGKEKRNSFNVIVLLYFSKKELKYTIMYYHNELMNCTIYTRKKFNLGVLLLI